MELSTGAYRANGEESRGHIFKHIQKFRGVAQQRSVDRLPRYMRNGGSTRHYILPIQRVTTLLMKYFQPQTPQPTVYNCIVLYWLLLVVETPRMHHHAYTTISERNE